MNSKREFYSWPESMVLIETQTGEVLVARDHIVAVCIEADVVHVLTSAGVAYQAIADEDGEVFRGVSVMDKTSKVPA